MPSPAPMQRGVRTSPTLLHSAVLRDGVAFRPILFHLPRNLVDCPKKSTRLSRWTTAMRNFRIHAHQKYSWASALTQDEPRIVYMPRGANADRALAIVGHGFGALLPGLRICFKDLMTRLGMHHLKSSGMTVAQAVRPSLRFVSPHRREHSALPGQNLKCL